MRKLMWFTIGFCGAALLCGYLLARAYYLPAVVVACLLLAVSLGLMLRWKAARLPAVVLFGCIAGLCWNFVFDGLYLSAVRSYDEQQGYLTFTAIEDPQLRDYGSTVEAITKLDGKTYRVKLYLYEETVPKLGDTITGNFQLHSALPGGSWESSYNCGNGIFLSASGGKAVSITSPESLPLACYPTYLRYRITDRLDSVFPADTVAFARALLLGDASLIDYETNTALKVSGIMHVVSVSGMHVSILFALVYLLTGRRKTLVILLGIPVLFLFAAIAGFDPPITRACLMISLMMLSMLSRREYDAATSLSFAVLVMLLANPFAAIHVGFQLSVGCMIGIIAFAEPIRDWLLDRKRLGRFRCRRLMSGISVSIGVSLGATIVTTPLCAIYFGMVSLVGIMTNLLTMWVITYVFYGVIAACFLGPLLGWLVSWGIRYALAAARGTVGLPFAAAYMDSVYMWFWLGFCYVLLVFFLQMRKKRPTVYGLCAALGLGLALMLSWTEPLLDDCRVTVLDVGQGQCILLQSQGKTFLVDCGGDSEASAADEAAGTLLSQGIARLDGVIVTHYDKDHAGGVSMLLSRVPTDELYLPDSLDEEDTSKELLSYRGGIIRTVTSVQRICFGDATITLVPSKNANVDNESGLCVLFQTKNCDILITGDRSAQGERELMESVDLPKLELLIVGHHGSKYSTSEELLEKTEPKYAIISVGEDNPYGHPTAEVLRRLEAIGCIYYRTDQYGTVIYRG